MEVEKRPVNGFGIASLVFGIVGILTICGCGIGFFFGLIGVIFGILGLTVLKRSGKGLAIAGVIVSGIALIFGTGWMILYIPKHNHKTTNDYATTSTTTPSSTTSSDLFSSYDKPSASSNNNSSNSSNSSISSTSNSTAKETVTPELKDFCDSYEAFMDQYIELTKSMDASTPEFMNEYSEYVDRLADFEEKAAYYNSVEGTMSDADYAYYTACMIRIQTKLMKVPITMSY